MDNALMGATTDITDDAWIVGIFTGISCREFTMYFSSSLLGNFDGFSADGDGMSDGLPDGLTDESDDE